MKGIRFGLTKVLIQITRKTSKKKSFFNWKHTNGFHSSYQTLWTFSRSYCQTMLHTFPDIKQRWHFQRVTGKQYHKLFQISCHYQTMLTFSDSYWQTILHTFPITFVYIKQYWHFQRIPSKLNYIKIFCQSSYNTILTLSESFVINYSWGRVNTMEKIRI